MGKFKRWLVPLCAILLLFLFGGVAYAAVMYTVNIPSTVQVVAPSPDYTIKVYSNPGCTQEVDSINWGQVQKGGTATRAVYVKNLGNQNINATTNSNLNLSVGTITGNTLSLSPGESEQLNILLTVKSSATIDWYSFTIYVNSNS